MLLIGSHALSVIGHHAILRGRTPGDTDLIGTWEEFCALLPSLPDVEWVRLDPTGNKIAVKSHYYGHIEFEFAWEDNSSQKLVELVENDENSVKTYFFPGGKRNGSFPGRALCNQEHASIRLQQALQEESFRLASDA
jgi:hypothetical protein